MTELMRRRRALMGAKGELPILNPSVGLTENYALDSNIAKPYLKSKTGAAVTDFIYAGTTGSFVYFNPNTPALWNNPNSPNCGKLIQYRTNNDDSEHTDTWNCSMNGNEKTVPLGATKAYVRLALPLENLSGVYAYNSSTGQIYYAGKDTQYYGKTNIND